MPRTPVLLGLIVLLSGAVGIAAADKGSHPDRREGSSLDIRRISHRHAERADGSRRIHHTVTMHDPWKSTTLRCATFIQIEVPTTNRVVDIFWDGRLKARVRDLDRIPARRVVGYPTVWRSSPRGVTVALRRTHLGPVGDGYGWAAWSQVAPCRCDDTGGQTVCAAFEDRAPQRGYLRHEL